ncbi:Uncharacterized protein dnm_083360 [Desulfonema magnum]|uniref:Uncharacterized protein n=2 Tax=Desulfonema magnum TaxID=45655 RepID=A0A975BW61_9BACT|nr:Uncharacterized protein dnm_083360 [Desulfonema magnum]
MNTRKLSEKPDRTDWHRLWGLMMTPLFERLGCETVVEMDLSAKVQRLDMVVVRRKEKIRYDVLADPNYYEGFEQLNEHNLISFKSFREVFNMTALEELYGHFTNYRKMKTIGEHSKSTVNLYVVTHHFPKDLFSRFEGKNLIDRITETIYDFNVLTPVRFIITRDTNHPILGLFSDNADQIVKSRNKLEKDGWLLGEVSSYIEKLYKYYALEGIDMPYTQEMFIKDHYPEWYDKIQAAKAEGEARGKAEGEARGKVIGEIVMAQRLLKRNLYSQEELETKTLDELKAALSEIETRLFPKH